MTDVRASTSWARLDLVQRLIVVIVPLGLLHHADHVGRTDHSSWPFRPELGPFTFTLLIYPVLLAAFFVGRTHWVRPVGLSVVAAGVLVAHTLVEPPGQIYGTWADNLSTAAPLYTVDPDHMHNLFDRELPLLGNLATVLSIVLTSLLVLAAVLAVQQASQRSSGSPAASDRS